MIENARSTHCLCWKYTQFRFFDFKLRYGFVQFFDYVYWSSCEYLNICPHSSATLDMCELELMGKVK